MGQFSFADSFEIALDRRLLAKEAAISAFANSPDWVRHLMRLRNIMVAPFGLVHGQSELAEHQAQIGIFPVVSEAENQIILGFNDKHLDFRVLVASSSETGNHIVTATTWVKTHNLLGRAYLFTIKRFHKIIMKSALNSIAA